MANIVDSYSENNRSASEAVSGNAAFNQGIGQSFTGQGTTCVSTQWYLDKSGSPTGNATSKIYAHSGTFGSSSVLTGAALATSDNFDVSTLTTTQTLATFNFSGVNQITLANGTPYVVTIEYSGGDASNFLEPGTDVTSPTHPGNQSSLASASWSASAGRDAIFYVNDNSSRTGGVFGQHATALNNMSSVGAVH